jgi:flagellin
MDAFTYSTSVRERTKFTIGSKDSPINIDITKMGPMLVQTGANEGQQLAIEIPALNAINLGVNDLSVSTQDEATESIDTISKAINQLSSVRAKIGAYANRLEHTITNLNTTDETMTSAYSRIMDVDIAEEMTEYSTSQVLVQAATSVLSQANERPQQVLQLLQ